MKRWKFAVLTMIVVVPIVFAIGSGGATSPPTLPPTETAATDFGWEQIVPGGDCACADGSEFNFWVRQGDPAKVVLFLEGGGACFDPTTCAFTDEPSTTYGWHITPGDAPALQRGIFDLTRTENPFADYTYIYVPGCTGDGHLGNVTREYSPELTVEHVGAVNGLAALSYLAETYGSAEQVVVVGESGGAIASPIYGGLVSDLVADAQVAVFADGSGAYPDDPDLNAGIGGLWGWFATMPDWEVNEGLTAQDWGIPRFWVQAGLHDPDIVMSRFDYAYDGTQTAFIEIAGADTADLAASIDANEAAIEAAGVNQHSYTAPGSEHTLVRGDDFYEMEVNGVTLVDWVSDVISGEDVEDVHCDDCGGDLATTTTG
jgi:hypothetical protein